MSGFNRELNELQAEIERLEAFVAEWACRFGFLAEKHARDSIESIDEVACVLGAEHKRLKEELAAQQDKVAEAVHAAAEAAKEKV